MLEFEVVFAKGIDEIWAPQERVEDALNEPPLANGLQILERKADPRDKHPKPTVGESKWSFSILSSHG